MPLRLPADVSTFFGREEDIRELCERFDLGERLVTILGPGGMGKTRLACKVADALRAEGDVVFADLTSCRTSTDAAGAVARAARLPLEPDSDLARAFSRRRRTLVVLDNYESILPDGVSLARALLQADNLVLLVTSRAALGIGGESIWPVEPLHADDAFRLFVARAHDVHHRFSATDAESIREIIRRVDGIPLAVELAAARAAVLTPRQLAARISLSVLTRPERAAAERHGSMRDVIADSAAMLDETDRDGLGRLSVFRGSFDAEAVEEVLGDRNTIDMLDRLRSRALIHTVETNDAELRFALYEPIREYASGLLRDEEVRRRHLDFFANRRRVLRNDWSRVELDLENFMAALRFALSTGSREHATEIALTIDPLLGARGQTVLRREIFDELFGLPSSTTASATLAESLSARGGVYREIGEMELARRDFGDAIRIASDVGAPDVAATAQIRLGELVEASGETAAALDCFARALAVTDDDIEAEARLHLGHAYRREGNLSEAEGQLRRALALFEHPGTRRGRSARAVFELGVVALFREEHVSSEALFEQSLHRARAARERSLEASIMTAQGSLLQEQGRLDAAIERHEGARAIFTEIDNAYGEGSTLYYLAGAYLERGQGADARVLAHRALAAMDRIASRRYRALLHGLLGALDLREGRNATGAESLATASRIAATVPAERSLRIAVQIHALGAAPPGVERDNEARALAASHPCDDPRFALRVLLGTRSGALGDVAALDDRGRLTLRNGIVIDLARRQPLRRIAAVLVERRAAAPGEAVSSDELIAAGWPDERIKRSAAINRLHVAIAELRRLGLREELGGSSGGYALSIDA